MVLHRKQGGKEVGEGKLLGSFPGAKENLEGEALSKVHLCAVSSCLWPEQTDPKRLVTPSWQPAVHSEPTSCYNKQSGSVRDTELQEECGKQSEWQLGCNTKVEAAYSTIGATEEIMARPPVPRAVVKTHSPNAN